MSLAAFMPAAAELERSPAPAAVHGAAAVWELMAPARPAPAALVAEVVLVKLAGVHLPWAGL